MNRKQFESLVIPLIKNEKSLTDWEKAFSNIQTEQTKLPTVESIKYFNFWFHSFQNTSPINSELDTFDDITKKLSVDYKSYLISTGTTKKLIQQCYDRYILPRWLSNTNNIHHEKFINDLQNSNTYAKIHYFSSRKLMGLNKSTQHLLISRIVSCANFQISDNQLSNNALTLWTKYLAHPLLQSIITHNNIIGEEFPLILPTQLENGFLYWDTFTSLNQNQEWADKNFTTMKIYIDKNQFNTIIPQATTNNKKNKI